MTRMLAYGDRGVLVELGSTEEAMAWAAGAADADLPGVGALVPAARTVLVVAADGAPLAPLRAALGRVVPVVADAHDGPVVEVPVTYDGEDLVEVARMTGLDERGVVAAHTGQTWRVAFAGFAPGFGYLVGQDDRLHVPRRDEPRTRVPRGSVGLAGEFTGVYPTASPGGWQLIGRTDVVLWDVDRDPPALLRPGVRVRFLERS